VLGSTANVQSRSIAEKELSAGRVGEWWGIVAEAAVRCVCSDQKGQSPHRGAGSYWLVSCSFREGCSNNGTGHLHVAMIVCWTERRVLDVPVYAAVVSLTLPWLTN
jgi:hypothetical protein